MWTVKLEDVPAFIAAWRTSAAWIAQHLPGDDVGMLLQDSDHPGNFISVAPSSNPERIQEVMSRPEFQDLWNRVMELSEDVKPHRMRVVASSAPRQNG
jgi:hypothetical protein